MFRRRVRQKTVKRTEQKIQKQPGDLIKKKTIVYIENINSNHSVNPEEVR